MYIHTKQKRGQTRMANVHKGIIRRCTLVALAAVVAALSMGAPSSYAANTNSNFQNISLFSQKALEIFRQDFLNVIVGQLQPLGNFQAASVESNAPVQQPTIVMQADGKNDELHFHANVNTHGKSYEARFEYWPISNLAKVERTRFLKLNASNKEQRVNGKADFGTVDPGTTYQAQLVLEGDGKRQFVSNSVATAASMLRSAFES
jgi:hypothetical protein